MAVSRNYQLTTTDGRAVYKDSIGSKYALEGRRTLTAPDSAASPEIREAHRQRAEKELGLPCVWVEVAPVEYVNA